MLDTPATAPKLRPGERLVAGKPYVFDATLLALHEAAQAVEAARNVDVRTLSHEALTSLIYAAQTVRQSRRPDQLALGYSLDFAAADRIERLAAEERGWRPDRVAVFGAPVSAAKAEAA